MLVWEEDMVKALRKERESLREENVRLREQLHLSTIDAANEMARANDAEDDRDRYAREANTAEAKLARCVEALREIKGRVLASQTHEIGPLEAKERLAAVLVSARAALAAAKGDKP